MEEIRDVFAEDLCNVIKNIVELVGFRARVEWKKRNDEYYVNVTTRRGDGLLIGKGGETLEALEYIVKAIMRKQYNPIPPIEVDVGGYKVKRERFLQKKALAIAKIVLETGKEMAMDPLTPKELKAVEEILKDVKGIKTYTLGAGQKKNLIIAPE